MNNIVVVEVSDGKIWNPVKVVADIIQTIQQGPIVIDLQTEGPCLRSVGLEQLLDQLNLDTSLITIKTGNLVKSSHYTEKINPATIAELDLAQSQIGNNAIKPKNISKIFGIFVGRSNWQRLALASYIWNNYQEQSKILFHYNPTNDYHRANCGLEEFLSRYPEQIEQVTSFVKQLPLIDTPMSYPIMWNQEAFNLHKPYENVFCEVVCETFFTGRCFFFTEKTLRSIIHRTPFIVQGPQWFLHNLRQLGFQTFNQWWTEGYDEDPADYKYQALQETIDYIGQQDSTTLNRWYKEMQPVFDNNIAVLKSLTRKTIINTQYHE